MINSRGVKLLLEMWESGTDVGSHELSVNQQNIWHLKSGSHWLHTPPILQHHNWQFKQRPANESPFEKVTGTWLHNILKFTTGGAKCHKLAFVTSPPLAEKFTYKLDPESLYPQYQPRDPRGKILMLNNYNLNPRWEEKRTGFYTIKQHHPHQH